MEAPKFLSQEFFKELTFWTEEKKVLLIIVSQVRDKIDSLFNEQTRSGGKALDFYAHTALWLSTAQKIIRKERAVGVLVKALTKKSKTPRPFRTCYFTLLYDYGLDNIGTNLDFLYDLRTEKGELKDTANSIQWSVEAKEVTPKILVEFIKAQGKEELFRIAKKANNLEGIKKIKEWIVGPGELKEQFEAEFGVTMRRGELITWIETSGKQAELTERVRAKWEAIEQSIRSDRPRKYL
jgi:hypothetical protein